MTTALSPAANVIVAGPGERRLRATFALQAGRFVGSVWLDNAQDSQELLREAFADEQPWPPSPPWQELHVHEQRGARALLLVGRAGTSHWSMAVSADTEQRAILFDVACRVRTPPEFLGSTLACLVPVPPAIVLVSHPIDEGCPPPIVEQTAEQFVVRPLLDTAPPATIRWKFSLAFVE